MVDGILLIDKPDQMTSFGVVARIRRVLSEQAGKKVKVGHTGTLDPFATGLMILCVGSECKNAQHYTKLDKVYEATIRLGKNSSTGDPEGEITDGSDKKPTLDEINAAIKTYTGEITQTPPAHSAIKIDGQRAYHLARQGKEVDMPTRRVTIHSLEVIDYDYPVLKVRADVSSGTYIRSLAEDLGKTLSTGAYCTQLRRISIDRWNVSDAQQLSYFGISD